MNMRFSYFYFVRQKYLLLFFVIFFTGNYSLAQMDSVKRSTIISINLSQIVSNLEAGLYFDHNLSQRYSLCFSGGYRFNQFHLTENLKYVPRKGAAVAFGFKRFYGLWRDKNAKRYIILQIHYKFSKSNGGLWQYGSSIFGGSYKKSFYSERTNGIGISFGTGFEKINKKFNFFDLGASVGIYYCEQYRHYTKRLGWDSVTFSSAMLDCDTKDYTYLFMPFIQFRLNFGAKF